MRSWSATFTSSPLRPSERTAARQVRASPHVIRTLPSTVLQQQSTKCAVRSGQNYGVRVVAIGCGGIAGINDEPGLGEDRAVVDILMIGDDYDRIGRSQGLGVQWN